MKQYRTKRTMSMALAAALAFTPISAFAASDIATHWAKDQITAMIEKGVVTGYPDGTFKPNNSITRAEFVTMLNNAMGNDALGTANFTDVKTTDWYYDAVSAAVAAGYASGDDNGSFRPNAPITRQEVAVMVANAMKLTADTAAVDTFADGSSIANWAKNSVGAVKAAGIMTGDTTNTFHATANTTRAEAVSTLNRLIHGMETDVDVVVDASGTVIENQTIEGNLTISEKIGEGEVTIKNTIIKGNLIVQGGGDDSVYLQDTTVDGLVKIEKENVRVCFEGKTTAKEIQISEISELTAENFTGSVPEVRIMNELDVAKDIVIDIPVDLVSVEQKSSINLGANVKEVTIAENAADAKVYISEGVKVDTLTANGKVAISGKGSVGTLQANVDGITISSNIAVNQTEVAEGVEKPSTSTSGGGGGGGGGSSSGGGNTPADSAVVDAENGDNLQELLNNQKVNNVTLNLTADNTYKIPENGLNFEGSGKLTINTNADVTFVVEDGTVVESYLVRAAAEYTQTTSGTNLKITAKNASGVVVNGDAALANITFDAPKAVVESDTTASVTVTQAKSVKISGTAKTVTITADASTTVVPVTITGAVTTLNANQAVSISGAGTIGTITANADVTINSGATVATVDVKKEGTTIGGTGAVEKIDTVVPCTIATATVTSVAVNGAETVTINTNVTTITVTTADTTITTTENATISTVVTNHSVIIDGDGAVNTIEANATSPITVTINGTTTVDTVVNTGSGTITIDGTSSSKPDGAVKVSSFTVKQYTKEYIVGDTFDKNSLVLEVIYDNGKTEEICAAGNTSVQITGFHSDNVAKPQTVTVTYAAKTATLTVNIYADISSTQNIIADAKTLVANLNVKADDIKPEDVTKGEEFYHQEDVTALNGYISEAEEAIAGDNYKQFETQAAADEIGSNLKNNITTYLEQNINIGTKEPTISITSATLTPSTGTTTAVVAGGVDIEVALTGIGLTDTCMIGIGTADTVPTSTEGIAVSAAENGATATATITMADTEALQKHTYVLYYKTSDTDDTWKKIDGATFTISKTVLERAIEAQQSFEKAMGNDNGATNMTWTTLVQALHYYERAKAVDEANGTATTVEGGTITSVADLKAYYESVTNLDMSGKDITSTGLTDVTISTGVLATLTGLENLNLSNTNISELGGLVDLTKLTTLDVSENIGITNLGALADLTALTSLNVSDTTITDLGALAKLTALTTLYVSNTNINDLNVMWGDNKARFEHLTTLYAQNLNLTSIAGLVQVAIASGFDSSAVTWNLSGTTVTDADAESHIQQITTAFGDNSDNFTAPTAQTETSERSTLAEEVAPDFDIAL